MNPRDVACVKRGGREEKLSTTIRQGESGETRDLIVLYVDSRMEEGVVPEEEGESTDSDSFPTTSM